jgi:endoglucanase
MKINKVLLLLLLYHISFLSLAKEENANTKTEKADFSIGVHFNHWFEAAGGASQINFNQYTKHDFINLKILGGNILRLPINFQAMTSGSPDYIIDNLLFNYLDSAIVWANETNIHIIIDNHTFYPDGSVYYTIEPFLSKIWDQISMRAKFKL